jgi:sugar phosphate isomerase/epimerase
VLPTLGELSSLLQWCKAIGLPERCIEVRVPEDHQQSAELLRIAAEHGLPAGAIRRTSRLRLAQDRLRGVARQRVGFLLHENPLGPLTRMNQFHRVMFTLCTYLQTLEAQV